MGRSIGFVGTGLMGRGMARCLLRKGHSLRAWNRTRSKAEDVAKAGGLVVATPAEAARGADVVFSMLADPDAVSACFEGPDGILSTLQKGAVVIRCGDQTQIGQRVLDFLPFEKAQAAVYPIGYAVANQRVLNGA